MSEILIYQSSWKSGCSELPNNYCKIIELFGLSEQLHKREGLI